MNQRSYFLKLTQHNSSSKVFCLVSVSKKFQPYRTKGITKLCINSVLLVFAYFVQDNLSRGNVGAIHVLQQIAIPGRFNFIKTDLSDLEDVSYSQLCVLYSCGLRVCVHVQSLWSGVTWFSMVNSECLLMFHLGTVVMFSSLIYGLLGWNSSMWQTVNQ